MRSINNFFEILFSDPTIIDLRILSFAKDHLAKITALNTAHQFDSEIAALTPIIADFEASLSGKKLSKVNKVVSTSALGDVEEKYIALIHQAEATVLTKFIKGSTGYLEFFPEGVSPYTKATKAEISANIDFFITKFGLYPAFATMLTAFTNLKTLFFPAISDQATKISVYETSIDQTSAERKALNLQLHINVLTIALMFPGQPEKVKVFFDTSLLFSHGHTVFSPGTVYPVKVKSLKTKEAGIGGLPGQTIQVVNEKLSNIQIWADSTKKKPIPTSKAVTLAKGDTGIFKMADISNKPTDKYLFIKNLDIITAEVTVEIVSAQIIPPFPTPVPSPE